LHGPGFDTLVALHEDRPDRTALSIIFLRLSGIGQPWQDNKRENAGRHEGCCKELTHGGNTL
jgi:hypothetical protein